MKQQDKIAIADNLQQAKNLDKRRDTYVKVLDKLYDAKTELANLFLANPFDGEAGYDNSFTDLIFQYEYKVERLEVKICQAVTKCYNLLMQDKEPNYKAENVFKIGSHYLITNYEVAYGIYRKYFQDF